MYRTSSLVTLFLVGLSYRELIHAEIENNGGLSPSDLGLNPKQFNKIKVVVTDVLKSYISTPNDLFTQKDSRHLSSPKLNAKCLSDSIVNEIGKFLHNLGLINSQKKNGQTSLTRSGQPDKLLRSSHRESIIHAVFDFLKQLLEIAKELALIISGHLRDSDYLEKGYSPSELSMPEVLTRNSPNTLKFVSFIDNSEEFLKAYMNCLNTTVTSFDLAIAFANTAKHSPKVTKRIVTNRLSKPIPSHPRTRDYHYTDLDAMTCRIVVENLSAGVFENCLKQCQLMNECVHKKMEEHFNSTDQFKRQSGQQLNRNINTLNTTCEVVRNNTSTIIICKNHSYRNFGVRLLSIIQKLFGKSFMRSAASQNAVNKLGNFIGQSKLGSEMMHEVNGLLEIYQEALKREQYLRKKSENDPRVMKAYNRHSRRLSQYTKNLSDVAMNSIDQIRGIASTIEQALVTIISTALGVNLTNHFRAIRTFAKFWHNLRDYLTQNFSSTQHPKPQIWHEFFDLNHSLTRSNDRDLTDGYQQHIFDLSPIFNRDWFTLMRSIARTNVRRKPNTIMTLANTFLLATMFYECIVILAGAIYRTENEEETGTRPIHQPINEPPSGYQDPPSYYDFDYQNPPSRRK